MILASQYVSHLVTIYIYVLYTLIYCRNLYIYSNII